MEQKPIRFRVPIAIPIPKHVWVLRVLFSAPRYSGFASSAHSALHLTKQTQMLGSVIVIGAPVNVVLDYLVFVAKMNTQAIPVSDDQVVWNGVCLVEQMALRSWMCILPLCIDRTSSTGDL